MVDDMKMCNTVEEEIAHRAQKVPIDRGSRATRIRPFRVAVMWQHGVGVVEVGDHDEPVVHTEPWDTVVLDDIREAVQAAGVSHGVDHCEDAEVGDDHDVALGFVKDHSVG